MIPLHILALRFGPLDFSDPLWLFALLALLPTIYLWKTSRVPASRFGRAVSLALRTILIAAIVLALAGTRLIWSSKGICVIFVLDQSQSVPGPARDIVRDRIADQVQKMSKDDQFVVIEFGGDAVLGSLPSPKGPMPPPAKVADPGRTDIARALRLALASFPADRQKRIVLFSDGNQNSGDALREARIASTKDVDVDVLLLAASMGHEVMVEQLAVPPRIRKDANFVVRAILSSDAAQSGKLLVTRDGETVHFQDSESLQVNLKTGTNVIDIPDSLADGGYHQYQVTYIPDNSADDTFAANNTAYAFTQVDAPGRILLVRGDPTTPTYLYDALRATGVPVLSVPTAGLPSTVNDLAPYDCVVFDNVSATDLSVSQMSELQRWVRDFGGGLVLIGGDHAFGPGGYKDTPLEEISPVLMDVNRKKHIGSLAIVIVNDKSGSMGAPAGSSGKEKMDLANEGSVQALKLLDSPDYAMVGSCDTEVEWMEPGNKVIPMTPNNKAKLISDTLSVKSGGGGIYCETALDNAYKLINSQPFPTMAKHVIMFADLQDSEQKDNCVQMAAENYKRFGVTTSVIGMGAPSDPDAQFQKDVAAAGHGRWDYAEDPLSIPRVFAKEAFLVARKPFVEKKEGITPTLYTSPLLEGFTSAGVPKIYGYVGTTLKPRATLAMHGAEPDDPLLAHWSIGLGKSVAFTSDATSRWGKDWVSWGGYSKFWAQVIRWVARTQVSNGLTTTTVIDGPDGKVIVDAADEKGVPLNNLQLKANIIAPDDSAPSNETALEQIGPGRYQGHFTAHTRGTYLVTVADGKTNAPLSTGGGVLSYPPEYRDLHPNAPLLHALADATAGTYLTNIENIFASKPDPVSTFWPLWQALLVAVASLLLFDIACRRLNIADWFRSIPKPHPILAQSPAATSSINTFRTVKTARREVDTQHQTLRDRVETLADSQPAAPFSPSSPSPGTTPAPSEGYSNRLMSAKKRAADQIKEQQSENKPE